MDTYCKRQGYDRRTVRFTFDGLRITETSTPVDLDMENGDTIDAMIEQVGGGKF